MNNTELLSIAAAVVPDRTAVIFEDQRLTFEQLQDRVNSLAEGLARLGVGKGDRVAILQVNCSEYIEAYFAAAKLDAVFVPLNFRGKAAELSHVIKDSAPKVLLVGERYTGLVRPLLDSLPSVVACVALEGRVDGWPHYADLLAARPVEERFPQGDGADLTIIMYTAGTTGTPKGVMLSHDSFSYYILNNVSPAEPEVDERNILTVPMYHIAGMQAVMAAIYGGRTLIIQRQFEPKEWMQLVEREKINRAMMVPTMLKGLMDDPDFGRYDLSTLRVITYGAASMPLEVIRRAIKVFPSVHFINAFGQTETAATITMLPPDDHVLTGSEEEVERKLRRLSSIGKPLGDVEVRVVDEEGRPLEDGAVGEIVARGPRLMKGYWQQAEATASTIRGGWLYTGDLGYFDPDGYLFLAGRSKDFIKRGGEMVSPEEVEHVLHSHPSVEEAAIIGVPDAYWGERIRAIVVLKRGCSPCAEEIVEHCRRHLSSFKKPESVVFADELPRNPLGKVLKRVLREQYSQPIEES